MRRRGALALEALALLVLPAAARAGNLEIGGYLETSHYVGLVYGDLFDYGNTNVLGLKLGADVNEDVVAQATFEVRNRAFTSATTSALLGDRSAVEPLELRMQEAYIDFYGLGTEHLDLRVGKQVITWGTADGLNPTSYLAPFDLENPLDFSSRLGVPALLGTFYGPGDSSLALAVVPLFTPSLLPVDLFASQMDVPVEMPEGIALGEVRDVLAPPTPQVRHTQVAARLAASVAGFDLSASYFYGYQTIPQLGGADVTQLHIDETPWRADLTATLVYPRTQAAGFDAATTIKGVGLWVEGAVFFPERLDAPMTMGGESKNPITGEDLPVLTIIEDTPYLKVVAGLDTTLPGDIYVNLQYLHGFFHELTASQIHDYGLMVVRRTFFSEALTAELHLGGEIRDGGKKLGGLFGLELSWQPSDATHLILGGLAARGDEGTTFDGFSSLDQVYLRARADF